MELSNKRRFSQYGIHEKGHNVTNLAALEKAANGEIVTLPGWTERSSRLWQGSSVPA